jgi:radical SAM superfamily enzyme YgiQ (UPF0313 family)
MSETSVIATLSQGNRLAKVEGTRVTFSPHRCFVFDDGEEDIKCLRILGAHLRSLPGLALFGSGRLLDYLLKHAPEVKPHVLWIIPSKEHTQQVQIQEIPVAAAENLPSDIRSVFLCETTTFPRMQMRRRLPPTVNVVEPTILGEIAPDVVPLRAWTPVAKNIYPIDVPEIKFKKGLDLILIDCPSRNLALMPNGLGYVNNALKSTSVRYQIFDLDVVAYHRFHIHRLFDAGGRITLSSGRVLPEDPWQAEHYDIWTSGSEMATTRSGHTDVIEFFRPIIDETVAALVEAEPKILGLSVQQCNEAISREIVCGVKAKLPNVIIVVGGFSCYNADIGRSVFPECDYMCVGEADLTVGLLMEALARSERPSNQPGMLSRYDTPDYRFIPAPMVHNLDHIEFPKYEWCDLGVYRNYNGYQLTPIIASRGCRWSRCTFCAERFYWRIRTPENFVDELEWLVDQGCHLFMFNESDLGGMPERVMEICDEIICRGLHRKVKLTGQLRVNKKQDRAFFEKLREANFVALRFGVDAFSENTLRLQMKGYTVEMISQNLKDCWEAGIFTEVNWVIGVPGETEDDVEEGIDLILKNRKYIGRLANINPLILVNGGVYWIDPDAHNIRFREPKEQLYAKYPRALPADSWYSVDPYIDAQVRKERFERIVLALHEAGFPVGAWANRIIEDVHLDRDPNRAGSRQTGPGVGLSSQQDEVTSGSIQSGLGMDGASEYPAPVPTPVKTENDMAQHPPAATPPLYGMAGGPPRVVRRLKAHNVVFFNGWYYGIPHALMDVTLVDSDPSSLPGLIKHTTEDGVLAAIEEASLWANSRGQYDAQENQRASESYIRADSVLGESKVQDIPDNAKMFHLENGEFLALNPDAVKKAFRSDPLRWFNRRDRSADIVDARSPLRRLATKLPPALRHKIKHVIREQSLKEQKVTGGLVMQTDRHLIGMLLRGSMDAYVKKPLTRILKRGEICRTWRAEKAIHVDGEEFSIVRVATKDSLPELMWSMDGYNVMKHDGVFYGLPHGVPIDWESDDIDSISGVFRGKTVKEVVGMIESSKHGGNGKKTAEATTSQAIGPAGEATHAPVLLGSLEGYNVVRYEGWIYGIPQSVGPLDLTEVDAIEMPGVIRDVSRDVVENEIIERVRLSEQAAN